jgi:hypothetical protein
VFSKVALVGLGTLVAFLFATNPVVADTARKVTGNDIKNGSVTGRDIKNQSLTGADVRESRLGRVPAARSADTATTVAPNSITSSSVADRSLQASDYAVVSGTVTLDLPLIPANDCEYLAIPTGASLQGATVSVSAGTSFAFSGQGLTMHASKSTTATSFRLVACNVTGSDLNPVPTVFDYVALR